MDEPVTDREADLARQFNREARIGFALIVLALSVFAVVAVFRITGRLKSSHSEPPLQTVNVDQQPQEPLDFAADPFHQNPGDSAPDIPPSDHLPENPASKTMRQSPSIAAPQLPAILQTQKSFSQPAKQPLSDRLSSSYLDSIVPPTSDSEQMAERQIPVVSTDSDRSSEFDLQSSDGETPVQRTSWTDDELNSGDTEQQPLPDDTATSQMQFEFRDPATKAPPDNRPWHTTRDDETLFSIAAEILGQASRYVEIIDLNKDRLPADPRATTRLPSGLKLLLPPEK